MEKAPDKIEIKGMVFLGKHGVRDEERSRFQRFQIDVDLYLDLTQAGESDHLGHTANYSQVRKKVQKIIEGESVSLIERLTHIMAEEILALPLVDTVTVGVWKLDLWPTGSPGVVITRSRENSKTARN